MSKPEEKRIGQFSQFIDHRDGTVTDTRTGLMWKRAVESMQRADGVAEELFGFSQAIALRSDFAGYSDWRLPSIEELGSLLDARLVPMKVDESVFTKKLNCFFWSSTIHTTNDSALTRMLYGDSVGYGKTTGQTEYVRLVRNSSASSFALTVLQSGTGDGVVQLHPDTGSYIPEQVARLTAVAQPGSRFVGWFGDVTGAHFVANLRMDSAKTVSAVFKKIESFALEVELTGRGTGVVARRPDAGAYVEGTKVTLTACAAVGSKFKGWSGDAIGQATVCTVKMDSAKTIAAEFDQMELYVLQVAIDGTGQGVITRNIDNESYLEDNTVTLTPPTAEGATFPGAINCVSGQAVRLTAVAQPGSRFVGWFGDVISGHYHCNLIMDSAKTVSAVFDKIKSFALEVKLTGGGTGVVTRSPDASEYIQGTAVTLTACATVGSKFKGWQGDATGQARFCAVKMDSLKTIYAEFDQIESYALEVAVDGTGQGSVSRNIHAETYLQGSTVRLTAHPAEGSVFSRWLGEASGEGDVCNVQMNSVKSVTALFEKVSAPDFGIAMGFESAEDAQMKSGDDAVIFNLSVVNNGLKQIRVELPLSSYVNRLGEEIEQTAWLTGLLAGNKGAVVRTGTFRKMGLVFFKSRLTDISRGDRLYVTVVQLKPAMRICFTLMCTDAKARSFMVINAAAEDQQETHEALETSPVLADVLQRVSLLEEGIANLLRRLDALPSDPLPTVVDTVGRSIPAHTLQAVLQGLALQDRISSAAFRLQLLPLDLLPSAIVNEINERALDSTGEIALEEIGDQFLVTGTVFNEVLKNWDFSQS